MMYYPFATQVECEAALEALHYAMADVARAAGYTVIEPYYVVGKNAATGKDVPNSLTTKWSDPVLLVDGRWGIPNIRDTFVTTYKHLENIVNLPELQKSVAEEIQPEDDLDETYILESVEE